MMYLDFEGDSEKEAIQLALDSLGLTEHDVNIEVLQKEKKGLFGIGKKEKAKVRVYYKEKNDLNEVVEKTRELIRILDPEAYIDVREAEQGKYLLNIESTQSSHLIGKNGNSLKSIQNIVNGINQKFGNKYKLVVDIDYYQRKREKHLVNDAVALAHKVLQTKQPVLLEAMNPFQRRLVHTEVGKIRGVKTVSEGEGRIKKIKIICLDEGT